MKNFIGLFFVAFALATNVHPAANQVNIVRGSADVGTNLVSLNEVAKRFMRNEKGETIIVLVEKTEPQKDSQKLAIIRQADPNASALLVADWTPDQHKVVRSKDASNLTAVIPAAQSKGIIQKPGHQDAHAEQGVVVTVVKGWSLNGVDLTPVTRQKFAKDITLCDAEYTSNFKAINVDTLSTQTKSELEEVDFEGVVFHSLKEYVDFSTNDVSKKLPAKEIFFAIDNDDLTFLKRVISKDEDVNTRDDAGNTPLHFAQSIDCVEVLVKNGADANVTNLIGNTPLHYAVYRNSLPIVKYLVEQGNAFVWIMNEKGQTPYDMALINSRYDIAEYLAPFYEVEASKSTSKKGKSKSKKHSRRGGKKREKANIDDLVESTAKLSL